MKSRTVPVLFVLAAAVIAGVFFVSKKMLSNAGFIAKAPQKLVEQEKEKLQANEKLLAKLSEQL